MRFPPRVETIQGKFLHQVRTDFTWQTWQVECFSQIPTFRTMSHVAFELTTIQIKSEKKEVSSVVSILSSYLHITAWLIVCTWKQKKYHVQVDVAQFILSYKGCNAPFHSVLIKGTDILNGQLTRGISDNVASRELRKSDFPKILECSMKPGWISRLFLLKGSGLVQSCSDRLTGVVDGGFSRWVCDILDLNDAEFFAKTHRSGNQPFMTSQKAPNPLLG